MQLMRRPGDTPAKEEPPALRPTKVPVEILPLEQVEQQHRQAQEAVAAYRVEMASLPTYIADAQRAQDWDLVARLEAKHKAAPMLLNDLQSLERDAKVALHLAAERCPYLVAVDDTQERYKQAQAEEAEAREKLAILVRATQAAKEAEGAATFNLRQSDAFLVDPKRGGLSPAQLDEVKKLDSTRRLKA